MGLVDMDGAPLVNEQEIPDAQVMTNLELTAYVAGITATLVRLFGPEAAQHIAVNDYPGYRRVMDRVTIAGDKPYL